MYTKNLFLLENDCKSVFTELSIGSFYKDTANYNLKTCHSEEYKLTTYAIFDFLIVINLLCSEFN